MAGSKNRRQGPAAASPEPNHDRDAQMVGSNGNAHVVASDVAKDDQPRENIFLLWPNIIGTGNAEAPGERRFA